MSDKACKTPLIDLLRSVPITHRAEWEIQWAEDGTPTGHAMSPIGKLCHDAADRIAELEATIERVGELPKSWMPVLTSNENGQITATRRVLTPGQCAIELQAALKEERT